MTLTELHDEVYGGRTRLKNQIVAACLVAVGDVINEDTGTDNHTNRLAWAQQVLAEATPGQEPHTALCMLPRVLMNAAIAQAPAEAIDNDVQFVVNGLIDMYANALAAETAPPAAM